MVGAGWPEVDAWNIWTGPVPAGGGRYSRPVGGGRYSRPAGGGRYSRSADEGK